MSRPSGATDVRAQRAASLLAFLRTIQKPGQPLDGVDERVSLVDAGLIDSLAVLEIVTYLEQTYGLDFTDAGVDPEDLTSVGGVLDLIERFVPTTVA